jgi:leucyl aminopeptidase
VSQRLPRLSKRRPAKAEALVVLEGSHELPAPLAEEMRRGWQRERDVVVSPTLGLMDARLVIGLRRPRRERPGAVRRLFAQAAEALVREKVGNAAVLVPDELGADDAADVMIGLSYGLYRFDRYRSAPAAQPVGATVVHPGAPWAAAARRGLPVAEGVALARDLVNTPAADMGPGELETAARQVAEDAGLRIKVLDAARCARMGMGALTAVGRASTRKPRMIVLEHRGARRSRDVLALAGKGICFDTGGLNIKTGDGMLLMKKDMGGAATVLGAALAIGRLAPRINVRFYLAVAENSIAGDAFRPGDVLTALDGTTIEVGNTDAEGRLVLADALALAVREGATAIVDVATLTGSALVALGRLRVPLIGNDDDLLEKVERAAWQAGERVWQLPNDPEYREHIRSKIADLKNVGRGREAGVIAGGLFIGHFAGEVPWAHLDISPASWSPGNAETGPAGATGTMVGTLVQLALGD